MKKISFLMSAMALMLAGTFTSCGNVDDSVYPSGVSDALVPEFTYDFAAVAAAGQDPKNFNGNQNNGQGFYGWEKADKQDSRRNDYKGYEWEEGSKLPEVCHVWRRSDRLNKNVIEGGLNCPNDREMAIDGLEAGSAVQIFYTAANADDKIVWAIGDGSSEGGPGADRATAKVNGVALVTGESTIESGDIIQVESVTPAEKGTGYIVVKVKKNMVISKIVIGKTK